MFPLTWFLGDSIINKSSSEWLDRLDELQREKPYFIVSIEKTNSRCSREWSCPNACNVDIFFFWSDLFWRCDRNFDLWYIKEFLVLVTKTVTLNCISRWNSAIRLKIQRNKSDSKRWILIIKDKSFLCSSRKCSRLPTWRKFAWNKLIPCFVLREGIL